MYCQLVVSAHPTAVTDYSLLPTPTVADTEGAPKRADQISLKNNRFIRTSDNTGTEFGAKLNDVAKLLPTPTTDDHRPATATRPGRRPENEYLRRQAVGGLLPTPNTSDANTANNKDNHDVDRKYLRGYATQGLLPTPRANKVNDLDLDNENIANRHRGNLEEVVSKWVVDGLLLTPSVTMINGRSVKALQRRKEYRNSIGRKTVPPGNLAEQITMMQQGASATDMMLPTPTCQEGNKATKKMREDHQNNLTAIIFTKLMPTPTMTDWKGAYPPTSIDKYPSRRNLMRNAYQYTEETYNSQTSQLNHQFVAGMMGFPDHYLDI